MTVKACIITRYVICALAFAMPAFAYAQTLGITGEESTSIGIYIKDLHTGKVVVDHNAECNYVPASVTKTVTAASAMTLLSEDYRFETLARLRGTCHNNSSVWDGDLEIIASGDPTLDSGNFPGNGGMADSIASSLKAMGITTITGAIRLIDDDVPQQGPVDRWEKHDIVCTYGAGWYAFNWKDNIYRLNTTTDETVPHTPDLRIEKYRRRGGTELVRDFNSSLLSVYTPYTKKSNYVWSTMPCPWMAFEHALRQSLSDNGITIGHEYVCPPDVGDTNDMADIRTVYSRLSPTRDYMLSSMMHRSDNMYAEGILRSFAPGESRAEALAVEKELWSQRGIDLEKSSTLLDGSGLTRANRLSPQTIASVLEYMAQNEDLTRYMRLFPVSGVSGTMRSFMTDTPFKGRLAFKTGSVNGVQCYAGYVIDDTQSWHPTHIVVIMVNGFTCTRKQLKKAIQDYLAEQLQDIIIENE